MHNEGWFALERRETQKFIKKEAKNLVEAEFYINFVPDLRPLPLAAAPSGAKIDEASERSE